MKSKCTLVIILLLLFGSLSYGQTASLANVTASPGENIVVPLNVTDFNNIGAITLYIRFNADVLQFTGLTGAPAGMAGNAPDSTVIIAWYGPPYMTLTSGLLCNLTFKYNGPGTSPLTFITYGMNACQVVQEPGTVPVNVAYVNGLVSPYLQNAASATLVGQSGVNTGATVTIPIHYDGFPVNVGAITQKIKYDPAKLTFIGATPQGTLTGAVINAVGGIITIAWSNTAGADINYPGSWFDLTFQYNGSTPTQVQFFGGCEITDIVPNIIPVSYFDATITPAATSNMAILGDYLGAYQGQDCIVPLDLSGFIPGTGGPAAITLNIHFDSPRLSFIEAFDLMFPGLTVINSTGSTISIAYSNVAVPSPSVNGTFLKLKFKYNGIGTANVTFGNGNLFSDFGGNTLTVGYDNGIVVPAAVSMHNAWIGNETANNNSPLLVPVYFTDMPTDSVGAITLRIGFDHSKLIFLEALSFPLGTAVSTLGGDIMVTWSNTIPMATINSTLGNLKFHYMGNGLPAEIFFKDGCEIAAVQGPGAIMQMNWFNGGVNINTSFKVSGVLKYNSDPNTQIPLSGYTVHLKTFPGDVTVTTAVTDANGYYELWAGNGNYTLDAEPNPLSIWYADLPDVAALFNYTFGTPIPLSNLYPFRILAGDVAPPFDGDPNLTDVVAVFNRAFYGIKPPDYLAPDWIFQRPLVIINNADEPAQDFLGLCTGNVLGSNPTP